MGSWNKKLIEWIVTDTECYECTSHYRNNHGYPMLYVDDKDTIMSRHIYTECFGQIPNGMVIRHRCDNPSCINPYHLQIGTMKDNTQDMMNRDRGTTSEKNAISKLKAREVIEIRVLLDQGTLFQREIAELYNVSRQCINQINTKRRW